MGRGDGDGEWVGAGVSVAFTPAKILIEDTSMFGGVAGSLPPALRGWCEIVDGLRSADEGGDPGGLPRAYLRRGSRPCGERRLAVGYDLVAVKPVVACILLFL